MHRYEDGIEPIRAAIRIAEQRDREIQEGWYQLLMVFYFETEDYPRLINVLRTLLTNWPKKDYLVQLAGIYGQEGEERYQTALYEAAHEMGWLASSGEYTSLASMLLSEGVPYQAAVLGAG